MEYTYESEVKLNLSSSSKYCYGNLSYVTIINFKHISKDHSKDVIKNLNEIEYLKSIKEKNKC